MSEIGKTLVAIGAFFVLLGAALLLAGRMGVPFGKLPGDITYRGKNVTFFAPLGTSLLLSLVLSAVLYLLSRFRR